MPLAALAAPQNAQERFPAVAGCQEPVQASKFSQCVDIESISITGLLFIHSEVDPCFKNNASMPPELEQASSSITLQYSSSMQFPTPPGLRSKPHTMDPRTLMRSTHRRSASLRPLMLGSFRTYAASSFASCSDGTQAASARTWSAVDSTDGSNSSAASAMRCHGRLDK